jgi:transposase
LATNCHYVLLPTFQTMEMVRKSEQESAADGTPASNTEESTTDQAAERDDATDTERAPSTRGRKRKIHSSTARAMLSQRHYKFRILLKYKMDRVGGVLVECGAEDTTKTCSACGELNVSLGGSREFRCQCCRGHFDRDINAARNIFHEELEAAAANLCGCPAVMPTSRVTSRLVSFSAR